MVLCEIVMEIYYKQDNLISGVDLEEQLLILKQNQSSWDQILKAWDSTFNERQKLINSKGRSDLWEFTEYPCLKRDTGLELVSKTGKYSTGIYRLF